MSSLPRQRIHIIGQERNEEGQFDVPVALCWTADHHLVVCYNDNHRLQVFKPDLTFLRTIGKKGEGEGEFYWPCAVCAGKKKEHQRLLFISDESNNRIQVMTVEGRFIRAFPCSRPHGVCVDGDDNVYVSSWVNFFQANEDFKIRVFDVEGKELRSFGSKGDQPGQLNQPEHLCFSDEHNQLFVADSNNHRISVFSPEGKLIHTFGSKGSGNLQFRCQSGICLDNDGVLLISDHFNDRLVAYRWDGEEETFLGTFGKYGKEPGKFNSPFGLCMSSNGRLAVADYNNHRVQVMDGVGYSSRLPFLCCVLFSQQPFTTE